METAESLPDLLTAVAGREFKYADTDLATVGRRYAVSAEATELAIAEPGLDVPHFLARLVEEDLLSDAVQMLAHAFGDPRPAIFWGTVCAQHALSRRDRDKSLLPGIQAAQQCLADPGWNAREGEPGPSEAVRRHAQQVSEQLGQDNPAGLVAFAAFCCRGSICDPDSPEPVPAPPFLYAMLVMASIMTAAGWLEDDDFKANVVRYLGSGLDIALGGNGAID